MTQAELILHRPIFASSGKLGIWEILQETLVGGVHRFLIPLGCYLLAETPCYAGLLVL